MAKELTGLGKFAVWVVLPGLIGMLGYRVVGPNIGGIGAKAPALRKIGQKIAKGVGKAPAEPEAGETSALSSNAPATVETPRVGTSPRPTSEGATEFQRIREAQPNRASTSTPSTPRRAPRRGSIDQVDN